MRGRLRGHRRKRRRRIGAGGAENAAPVLTFARSRAISIGEGTSIVETVEAVDPDGDALTFSFEAPAGVEATMVDQTALVLHAGYGSSRGDLRVTATDPEGAATTAGVLLEVAPLTWGERVEWAPEQGPEAREHATVLVDDASGSIYVMFGSGYDPYLEPLGDAWRFDVATRVWSEVALEGDVPPASGSRRLAGVRGSGEGWLYGGYGEGQEAFGEVHHVSADGDVLTFDELSQANPPGARFLHVFAFDPGSETFAMFGGGSTKLEGDTWTMRIEDDVATWTLAQPSGAAGAPSPRFGAFSGMDEANGRMVLFSGQTSFSNSFGQDTWVLDMRAAGGPTWTEVSPAGSPPGRRNGTSVWDPQGPRLFVFGGTSDGATSQPGLFAFDARPGHESWAEVDREDRPPMRSSGFGAFVSAPVEQAPAYDATTGPLVRGAVWMGFGNDDAVYRDLAQLSH